MTAFAITTEAWDRHCRRLACIGLCVGIFLTCTATILYRYWTEATTVVDPRMERACGTWPRYEGEALTVVVIGGKVTCWQMGRNR